MTDMPKRKPPGRTGPKTVDDVLALPPGTVLRASDGVIYERFEDSRYEKQNWYEPADEHRVDPALITLPGRVLYRPHYKPWDDG